MAGVKGRSGGARNGAGRKRTEPTSIASEVSSTPKGYSTAGRKLGRPPNPLKPVIPKIDHRGGAREGAGRKPFEPTADQRNVVEMAAAFGLTPAQICLLILNPTTQEPIDSHTLHKYFHAELDRGHPKAIANVAGALYNNATKHNNVTAQTFYLRTRGKWSDAPLQFEDVTKPGDDITERLVLEIARLRVADGRGSEEGDFEAEPRTTH